MTMIDRTREYYDFNEAAMRTASALQEVRAAAPKRVAKDRPRHRLFGDHNRVGLGVALEYERMGEQPVSDDLQVRAESFGFRFEHLGLTIGSIIHGVDCRITDDPELTRFIRDVLLERKVVFFRDQHLSEDDQVAFGRTFGDLDAFPFGRSGENPFILQIEHSRNNPGSECGWHTDVTWMERPSLGSIAQCIEVPPIGGDTLFADSHAAYLGLSPELQERIAHVHGINDYRMFVMARGYNAGLSNELVERIKSEIPFGVSHPLLRTHPETGKTALFLHGGFLRHDSLFDSLTGEPLDPDESVEIVAQLLAQHGRPEYSCRFSWGAGSIAFWDNRAVQHYATSDYHPHRRVLRRVTVSGDRPYHDPPQS